MMVRDRPRLTKQALKSLHASRYEDARVTILDDRSLDETQTWLLNWGDACGADLLRNDRLMGTGELRNLVIGSVREQGEFLYLSDNDVFFKQGWLETLIRCYEFAEKEGFRVLGAYNHPFHHPTSTRYTQDAYAINEVNALALQSMLMRWETWDKYGPFCETPVDKVCQSEDVDFTNRLKADGGRIGVVSPALIVSTGITNTFGEHIPGWELVKAQCPEGVICE